MTTLLAQILFASNSGKPLRAELVQALLVLLFLADGDPEQPFRCSIARIAEHTTPKRRLIHRPGNDPETGRFLTGDTERQVFAPEAGSTRALGTKYAQLVELGFIGRTRASNEFDGEWVSDGPGTPYKWWFVGDANAGAPKAAPGAAEDIAQLVKHGQMNPLELTALARLRWQGQTLGPYTWNELRELAGGASRHGLQRVFHDCKHLVRCETVPNPDPDSRAEAVQLTFTIPTQAAEPVQASAAAAPAQPVQAQLAGHDSWIAEQVADLDEDELPWADDLVPAGGAA